MTSCFRKKSDGLAPAPRDVTPDDEVMHPSCLFEPKSHDQTPH